MGRKINDGLQLGIFSETSERLGHPVALVVFITCDAEFRDDNRLIETSDSLVNLGEDRVEGTYAAVIAKIVFGKSID